MCRKGRSTFIGSPPQWATLFIRLPAKGAANLISYRGVRRITAKIKTVICEQAPNHGSYFAYARLCFRKLSSYRTIKIIHKHFAILHYAVKMHKNDAADLTTIYKLPINCRKSLATDSWMCYLLITATETLPVTIPIPIPKHLREHEKIMKWPVQT